MNSSQRDARIIESLKIKPVNHGQVHTFQIAIPASLKEGISSDRVERLKQSLAEKGSNLVPIIVRRTDAYSEEEQFEVIYGADWCLAAKELDTERLWVWVFDLDDEQAVSMREEVKQLVGISESSVTKPEVKANTYLSQTISLADLESILKNSITQNVRPIVQRLDQVASSVSSLDARTNLRPESDKALPEESLKRGLSEILAPIMEKIAVLEAKQENILKELQSKGTSTKPKLDPSEIIDLNTATVSQLKKLHRLGPKMSSDVIKLRDKKGGRFQSIQELTEVNGISDKMVSQWSANLSCE